jgi:hypothetical protein
MERLTKRYNENTGTYEYIDAFSGSGILSTIINKLTSKVVKDTAKTIGTKALEAGASKFGSEIGTRAASKVISAVDDRFKSQDLVIPQKVTKVNPNIESKESFKPLGNVIIKELNKKSSNETTSPENIALKKQYYGYGNARSSHPIKYGNKQFKNKLNKLLK